MRRIIALATILTLQVVSAHADPCEDWSREMLAGLQKNRQQAQAADPGEPCSPQANCAPKFDAKRVLEEINQYMARMKQLSKECDASRPVYLPTSPSDQIRDLQRRVEALERQAPP